EGMGLILVFLGIYIYLFQSHHRFPQALLLVPLGVALMWLLNAIRIAALIALGTSVSTEMALGSFHSLAGWFGLTAVFLGLVAFARATPFFSAVGGRSLRTGAGVSSAGFLLPFLAVVATAMVTGGLSTGLDLLYPLRIVAALAAMWLCRATYRQI